MSTLPPSSSYDRRDFPTAGETRPGPSARIRRLRSDPPPRIVGFCVLAGGVCGLLAHAVRISDYADIPVVIALILSCMIGGFAGLVCTPVCHFLLRDRDTVLAKPLALWSAAIVAAALGLHYGPYGFHRTAFYSACALVAVAGITRLYLPRVWRGGDRCRACGYDVRASWEFGRCPECGTAMGAPCWYEEPARYSRIGRAGLWMVRRPITVVLCVVVVLMVPHAYGKCQQALRMYRQRELEDRLVSAIRSAAKGGELLSLAEATGFGWDRVYVFSEHADREQIEAAMGFSWPQADRRAELFASASGTLLVFVRGNRVAGYGTLPRSYAVYGTRLSSSLVLPAGQKYEVVQDQATFPFFLVPVDEPSPRPLAPTTTRASTQSAP